MNTFRYIFLTIFILCVYSSISSQTLYNGHISDAATGEVIEDVLVELIGAGKSMFSNEYGDVLLIDGEPAVHNPYQFFHNTLIWEGTGNLTLRLMALDGRIVIERNNLGTSGQFLFPTLSHGMYLLQLVAGKDQRAFKVFSNGAQTYMVDKRSVSYVGSQGQPDTLRFSKPGYFTIDIPVTGRDTVVQVYLLKGNYEDLHYFLELLAPVAFDLISDAPSRTHASGVRSVKVMYDERTDLVYYINADKYDLHFTFARDQLDWKQGHVIFNRTQYIDNRDRIFFPANINYYEGIDTYVLHLVAASEMSCEHLYRLYQRILETSYFGDKLVFFANKSNWDLCDEIPQISSDELYGSQNYQALNLRESYGYLTQVDIADLEDTYLSRRDIVLLNGIPNDVSVVAGIITTEFQTPLSHINVLSNSRGTPNMALRDGWTNPKLTDLIGQLVYLNVGVDSFDIRPASLDEAELFWSLNEPQIPIFPDKNTSLLGLVDLSTADHSFVDRIGGKAANFSELLKVQDDPAIPTPELAFAIPFYYYEQHLKQAGLDLYIHQLLQDSLFLAVPSIRQEKLEELRDSIKNSPIDPALVSLVKNQIQDFQHFPSIRFRSSTNAEDLEEFSGAGLYSSYSAKKGHASKTIENAIRKVWASLWNWRAFEERSYFKIDHESCAMGILVHRSFPDEDANGVMITRNLYNDNPGFTINVQYKEHSIVFPEPGVLHDQIMLMAWSIVPDQDFMIEYLTFSNVPELKGERVMTDEELLELGDYAMRIKQHFYQNVPHSCGCDFKDFAVDIEFKVDSDVSPRKIYIKQARLFQ